MIFIPFWMIFQYIYSERYSVMFIKKIIFFLVVICVGSLLDVVYFFPVIRTAFFSRMPE